MIMWMTKNRERVGMSASQRDDVISECSATRDTPGVTYEEFDGVLR